MALQERPLGAMRHDINLWRIQHKIPVALILKGQIINPVLLGRSFIYSFLYTFIDFNLYTRTYVAISVYILTAQEQGAHLLTLSAPVSAEQVDIQ